MQEKGNRETCSPFCGAKRVPAGKPAGTEYFFLRDDRPLGKSIKKNFAFALQTLINKEWAFTLESPFSNKI